MNDRSLPANSSPTVIAARLREVAAKDLDDLDCWDQQVMDRAALVLDALAQAVAALAPADGSPLVIEVKA